MKKFFSYSLGALALLVGLAVVFQAPLREAAYAAATDDMFVDSDDDSFDPGLPVGTAFPALVARYDGHPLSDIGAFAGPTGTVFMASRSFGWCPYCMKQLVQLSAYSAEFEAAGIGLVVMTYDAPEVHEEFSNKHNIAVPMLSDVDAQSFITLGILNDKYGPGEMAYGIPHPGMFIIDPEGVIVGKLFLEAYSSRVSAAATLEYAQKVLSASGAGS